MLCEISILLATFFTTVYLYHAIAHNGANEWEKREKIVYRERASLLTKRGV